MKKVIGIFFLIAGLFFACQQPEVIVQNLRCDYLVNPIAIENRTPSLSWQLQSDQKEKNQKAYRILVASNLQLLKEGKADCWDSGIVESDQSIHIIYEGKPLSSRQDLYWKVKVWDENNEPTRWSKPGFWSMGLLEPSDWSAKWIADKTDPYPDSVLTYPAPFFRKEFSLHKPVRKAKAYVCGLGFYEMYLNGKKVGDQVLAPAVTNFDERIIQKILYFYDDQSTQRVLYNTFDVTPLLQKKDNTMGVILGNGWYNQRDRTVEGCLWYDTPRLILQLEIEYSDGTVETVKSDHTWKTITGPLLHDALFTGEIYDARLELGEWNKNGYDDNSWNASLEVRSPTGTLHSQVAPFDEVTRTIKPIYSGQVNDSTYRFALPEMVSGWAEVTVKGEPGDKIRMRFIGEENQDFGQYDTYILKGGDIERWEPRFTWHAFRYIEVITHHVEIHEESLLVKVVHTNPEKVGSFECSNELFNKINEVYLRTQEANFHGSISSDCPHRERIAYTGDGQVVVESSILSYDMSQFYRKWFDDMRDAQNKNTGYVPHTTPFAGGGGGPAWGSAYVIMPWYYYTYYGDIDLLKQHYKGMKQWVDYLGTRTDERGIVVREEPNGWCLGDWCTPDNVEIPEPLVNTAYYYHCIMLLKKVATVLHENNDAFIYEQLSHTIKENFNRVFFHEETNSYWEGRQGANVFPLAFGLVPEAKKELVFNNLLAHLKDIDYHFDTGILATPLLINVLTENGRIDIAYRVMNQRTKPGYAYLLDAQNTCLWERWDGRESHCHPMFGSVVAWFYHSLAGIRVDMNNPGMKHIIISPQPTEDLTYCKASYQSQYGLIRSEWEIENDRFILTVEIPTNTTATVILPTVNGKSFVKDGRSRIELNSGSYNFMIH